MEQRTMSHINEALKKAQKEKDTLYQRYRELLNGQKDETGRKKFRWKIPVMVTMLCVLIVGLVAVYYLQKGSGNGDESLRHVIVQRNSAPSGPSSTPAAPHGSSSTTMKPEQPPKQGGPDRTQPSNAPEKPMTSPAQAPATRTPILPATPPSPSSGISPAVSSSPPIINKEPARQQNQLPGETPSVSAPPDPRQLYERALAYQRTNNLTMAERLYVTILKIDPKFVTAMNNLGLFEEIMRNWGD